MPDLDYFGKSNMADIWHKKTAHFGRLKTQSVRPDQT